MSGDSDDFPDVSPSAVNERLRAFVAEVRARPEGDDRPFAETDRLLCAYAEQALETQAEGERKLAEIERADLVRSGGRLQ